MSTTAPDALFWKRKLAAFLHDSPSKALDIAEHEIIAEAGQRRSGNVDDQGRPLAFDHEADWTAAAADRLPFPHWGSSGVRCAYDPSENPFRHPMDGTPLKRGTIAFTAATAEEIAQNNQPAAYDFSVFSDPKDHARAEFFAHWRLWQRHTQDIHAGFAALPADTRLPDHTIWSHIGIVSAFEGARYDGDRPALLKFQLGPVQDFIAAARSTRDLWSGSYLLSWLMATGLAALANEIGPDAVIFPNLYGQPLFDLRFKKDLWERLNASCETHRNVWSDFEEHEYRDPQILQTPNLPNIFLALVPASRAAALAAVVADAIKQEWNDKIAQQVRAFAQPLFDLTDPTIAPDAAERFRDQVARHLDIAWQVTEFPDSPKELIELAKCNLPSPGASDFDPVARVQRLVKYFTEEMDVKHRDARFYREGSTPPKSQLNNVGLAWSLAVALNGWQLDATRSLRTFHGTATSGPRGNQVDSHGAKDALTGREAMLFGGSDEWLKKVRSLGSPWANLFRHRDEIGAITLIKRTWHLAYLRDVWGLQPQPMPNTHDLATGTAPADYSAEERSDTPEESEGKDSYYAILAFDGDSIGQWVSGAKTPKFATQLADHCHRTGKLSPRGYFAQHPGKGQLPLLELQRPLSPGYHLQFSAALTNFAIHCAPRVVAKYAGRVLYAGGDDVLAMLPAQHAFACADDLQRVFRGLGPTIDCGITEIAPGFLSVEKDRSGRAIPLILPGPTATASAGLAIAHYMQPFQDVVRAAQAAEKQAKKLTGKHALAVKVFKRSGETNEWSCRFDPDAHTERATPPTKDEPKLPTLHRGGLIAAQWLLFALGRDIGSVPGIARAKGAEVFSSRFPYRLAALLEPYLSVGGQTDTLNNDEVEALLDRELDHVIDRQRGPAWATAEAAGESGTKNRLRDHLREYLKRIPGTPTQRLSKIHDLLSVTAFLGRQPALKQQR